MGVLKEQSHLVVPVSNWFASFSFHMNQTNNSWDTDKQICLINTTAVTLGQSHPLLSPDLYFFVQNIKDLAQTALMWETKVIEAVAEDTDTGLSCRHKLKT